MTDDNYFKKKAFENSKKFDKVLGYDAYEITAHGLCAPDHEPVQGRIFLKSEFEKMQKGEDFTDIDGNHYTRISRPIGGHGCMHMAHPCFSSSTRVYTDEMLRDLKKKNDKGCKIDGKHYTLYEANLLMRKVETNIKHEKEIALAAQNAEDNALRRECEHKIHTLLQYYYNISKESGLARRSENFMVYGLKRVNYIEYNWICNNLPELAPKALNAYTRMKNTQSKKYLIIKEQSAQKGFKLIDDK